MIVVEWKLTTFLRQEPWLDAPPRTRGVARLRAARGATGDPTRAWWRVQPRLLTQKRGQFLHYIFIYVISSMLLSLIVVVYDDVIKWRHFRRYWPFVRGIHRSSVNSPHKGQWRGALMFSLIWAWINGRVNNGDAGDLRRHGAHYDVIVVCYSERFPQCQHNRST